MLNNLPIYQAVINEGDGIYAISLVEDPAVEQDFICFSKNAKFSVADKAKHLITGVIMACDMPIYRNDRGYEYYITFNRETIETMARKMLEQGTFKNIDCQHNGDYLPQGMVQLVELYIKDTDKGITPKFSADVNDGSLFGTFRVNDDDLWKECLNGDYLNGFSLAGYFDQIQIKNSFNNNKTKLKENVSMKIKELLKRVLATFGNVETDKGKLYWEGDEDLKEGYEVVDEQGNAIADGEYSTNDGKVITVKDGKVASITDAVAEVAPTNDTDVEAEEAPGIDEPTAVDALRAEIDALKSEIATIKEAIEAIKKAPATDPVEKEFQKAVNVKNNKAAEIAKYLKK